MSYNLNLTAVINGLFKRLYDVYLILDNEDKKYTTVDLTVEMYAMDKIKLVFPPILAQKIIFRARKDQFGKRTTRPIEVQNRIAKKIMDASASGSHDGEQFTIGAIWELLCVDQYYYEIEEHITNSIINATKYKKLTEWDKIKNQAVVDRTKIDSISISDDAYYSRIKRLIISEVKQMVSEKIAFLFEKYTTTIEPTNIVCWITALVAVSLLNTDMTLAYNFQKVSDIENVLLHYLEQKECIRKIDVRLPGDSRNIDNQIKDIITEKPTFPHGEIDNNEIDLYQKSFTDKFYVILEKYAVSDDVEEIEELEQIIKNEIQDYFDNIFSYCTMRKSINWDQIRRSSKTGFSKLLKHFEDRLSSMMTDDFSSIKIGFFEYLEEFHITLQLVSVKLSLNKELLTQETEEIRREIIKSQIRRLEKEFYSRNNSAEREEYRHDQELAHYINEHSIDNTRR